MNKAGLITASLAMLLIPTGCSKDLSRLKAERQIDAMLKPHPIGAKKQIIRGGVPGFELSDSDVIGTSTFHIGEHKEYGGLVSRPEPPTDDDILIGALAHTGFVTVQEEGPKTVVYSGTALNYAHSRTVRMTQKAGQPVETGYSRDYPTGFSCYPEPDFAQCNLPPLVKMENDYKITGIVQDQTKAKVNLLISWKLTTFGLELRPDAIAIQANADKMKADFNNYTNPELYSWVHFLNQHQPSGSSPATILFQRFDDGWRIVDEKGRSENDFN